jgi:hypothetical protein
MTADLNKAASAHTLYLALNFQKVPSEIQKAPELKEFAPVLTAKAVTLTANLKGKELSVAARASFPDAATAGKAKDSVQNFITMATGQVDQFTKTDDLAKSAALKPAVDELNRTLKNAKVETSGSDVTLAASYKADFDINAMVAEILKEIREGAPKLTAQNNLRQIGLGLINYCDVNGGKTPIFGVGAKAVPLKGPTDKALLSWRVAILPYIEQGDLYKQFKLDEPWDSEHNKKLIDKMPKIYAPVTKPGKPGETHLQMVLGVGAMPATGVNFPGSFKDGTSNTISVVEAANPVIWTKPDDVVLTGKEAPKDFRKKFGGQFPGGFYAALWDGSARFIPDTMSDRTLGAAFTPAGGEVMGADWWGGQPAPPPIKR